MQITVEVVNAFIDGERGGNPAGVVLDADALTHAQKLSVAAAVGLSETAFVMASQQAAFRLEFFTPTRQIAHCGHATVASFSLLRQRDRVQEGWTNKETIDGLRDIRIDGEFAFMEQRAPRYQDIARDSELGQRILASLNLGREALREDAEMCRVNTGNSFVIVPVKSAATLKAVQPAQAAIAKISEELDLIGYYLFSTETQKSGRHAGTRMFAPRYGIAEEAGTGMAAGPLACYLHDKLRLNETRFLIEQGWLMPEASPSVIQVNLELADGQIQRLMAGGVARVSRTLSLTLD